MILALGFVGIKHYNYVKIIFCTRLIANLRHDFRVICDPFLKKKPSQFIQSNMMIKLNLWRVILIQMKYIMDNSTDCLHSSLHYPDDHNTRLVKYIVFTLPHVTAKAEQHPFLKNRK